MGVYDYRNLFECVPSGNSYYINPIDIFFFNERKLSMLCFINRCHDNECHSHSDCATPSKHRLSNTNLNNIKLV